MRCAGHEHRTLSDSVPGECIGQPGDVTARLETLTTGTSSRTSLILDARYMALLLPVRYRTTSGGREHAIHVYERTRNQLDAICASQRLKLPFEGVLLIWY